MRIINSSLGSARLPPTGARDNTLLRLAFKRNTSATVSEQVPIVKVLACPDSVATLLGHRSLKTTMAFYSGLRTRAAGKHFASILERDRRAVAEKTFSRRRTSKR